MSTGTASTMVDGMRSQRRRAPESLAGRVLAEVGLIDRWTEIAGPIGQLYVAWGKDGVTAVERKRLPIVIGRTSTEDARWKLRSFIAAG